MMRSWLACVMKYEPTFKLPNGICNKKAFGGSLLIARYTAMDRFQWLLKYHDGRIRRAKLSPATMCTRFMLCLVFTTNERPHPVIVYFVWSTPHDEWRRLQVYLRFAVLKSPE